MQYVPNTEIKQEMLNAMGMDSIDELFSDIPKEARVNSTGLGAAKSELVVSREMEQLLSMNRPAYTFSSFIGGGIERHFVPPAVDSITSRSEFYTAYTPYQPEISQGMLQTLFEYQTAMSEITGMEVANSSMYDWASALPEAALMSMRAVRSNRFVVAANISPKRLDVLHTYAEICGFEVEVVDFDHETGKIDLEAMAEAAKDAAGVYVEVPNYFGILDERATYLKEKIGKALLVVGAGALSLGAIKRPGDYGADIVIGEGQPFGMRVNYGGPLVGIFATTKKLYRKMPGRLIGLTEDADGRRAFVMTAQTREQHIRRAKATSNICSNQALCSVTAAVYLSLLGKVGLRELAELNMKNARALSELLCGAGAKMKFSSAYFNEFVITVPEDAREVLRKLEDEGIFGGILAGKNDILVCATELNTVEEMENYASALKDILGGEA